ncbi:MAG TPA: UDP-N-acetylglucosamine 1-carboxyvinyltransferase [Gammaproteobacteria bacterium]|nr:UDP-N-acetylglucosamine 1-carboxyvinyltransferase [Gammaproteobacteria bacterium]
MKKLKIQGGHSLRGEIHISGSKNAALSIIAASIMTEERIVLENIPHLEDVTTMIRLIAGMGVSVTLADDNKLILDSSKIRNFLAPYDLVKTMRASILVLGPLIARFGEASVSLPGGCAIGARPVNLHLDGLKAMGADVEINEGYICAKAKKLKGAHFSFSPVSVTGTANLMMAGVMAEGQTILENAATEPEVINLGEFLLKMGAKIKGLGTRKIMIDGVNKLCSTEHKIIPDRIETGTFLVAAAMTKGSVLLKKTQPEHLQSVLDLLRQTGAVIFFEEDTIELTMNLTNIKPADFTTQPYPGIPTDMQAQLMVLNAIAPGNSIVVETIFENRFMHVLELQRMGADISLSGNTAYITGVKKLQSAPVMATDLRASAALVLAGLVADGETHIDRIYHIDRGYECIESKLSLLGAKVARIET